MIITFILNIILIVFAGLFNFIPAVTISSIPVIGSFLSNLLITMVGIFNGFMETFPYAVIVWHMFLWVILPFEILLIVVKFFLGSRVPANTD